MNRLDPDVRAIKRHLPPAAMAPEAYAALKRMAEKARRFDNAVLLLAEEPLPPEFQELAAQIVAEIRA